MRNIQFSNGFKFDISEQSQNMKEKSSTFDTFQFLIGLRSEIPQPLNIILKLVALETFNFQLVLYQILMGIYKT